LKISILDRNQYYLNFVILFFVQSFWFLEVDTFEFLDYPKTQNISKINPYIWLQLKHYPSSPVIPSISILRFMKKQNNYRDYQFVKSYLLILLSPNLNCCIIIYKPNSFFILLPNFIQDLHSIVLFDRFQTQVSCIIIINQNFLESFWSLLSNHHLFNFTILKIFFILNWTLHLEHYHLFYYSFFVIP